MKIFNIISLFVLSALVFQSCDKSEQLVTQTEGGLIELKNPSINYVVGNPGPYTSAIRVYQGDVKTTKIEVKKTFYSTRPDTLVLTSKEDGSVVKSVLTTRLVSNTVSYTTINLTGDQNSIESFSFLFTDLIDGLTVEKAIVPNVAVDTSKYTYEIVDGFSKNDVGSTLPTSDGDYLIGDYWQMDYYSTVDDGRVVIQNTPTKVTVATRYAGSYTMLQSHYWRIGVDNGDMWNGESALIESVDAKTYVWSDWGAPYGWDANGFLGLYFQRLSRFYYEGVT